MAINVTPIPKLTAMAAPAFTLGTANAAGDALTAVASNSTLLAFDAVVPAAVGVSSLAGDAVVSARRDHVHSGATDIKSLAKAWAFVLGTGVLQAGSFNVTSTSRQGAGDYTITWATDFDGALYSPVGNAQAGGASDDVVAIHSLAAGVAYVDVSRNGSLTDLGWNIVAFGNQ